MAKTTWHLAQINIAKMIGNDINEPIMKTFVAQLEEVNSTADNSKGFVWRLKDESNSAASINAFDDTRIIVNMSVWETIEDLKAFVYNGRHLDVLRQKKEWFVKIEQAYVVLWYIPAGHVPTIEEAKKRLRSLEQHGPTQYAFNFKSAFSPPSA